MGQSGSGKSTFVNAICGLHNDEDEDAAKTGVVETTMEPTAYPHPKLRNLLFWDLPGTGTTRTITQSINYDHYDLFIIIASERVRHSDMELAKKICSMKKKFYFVRNKIDTDLRASKLRRRKTYNERRILHEIRDNCITSLRDGGVEEPIVFLLSCLEMDKELF
ncbi:interferon-inducible GTPase 1-like [Ranitomeya imitator]|uniref:interferon-inducible GTPase 1-like n=1 Tax=Ranitomeya imitator TaxID=111125 RepID=UPI0037E89F6B